MAEDTKIQELSNDKLKVNVSQSPGCQVKLDVELTPEETSNARKTALKKVKKEVSIPGFRKGKAPEAVILEHFGPQIKSEWSNVALYTCLKESLELAKINPLSNESIKKPKVKEGPSLENGLKVTFEFESFPKVPEVDLSKLELEKKEKVEVSKEMVDDTLEQIRLDHAKWEEVKDRAVEEGDFATVNAYNIDQDPPSKIYDKQKLAITEGKMNNWLRDLLIGMKPGEVGEGISEPPQDSSKEERENFQPAKYRFELIKIEKSQPPPLDDELAKKVKAASLEDLIKNIKDGLGKDLKRNEEIGLKNSAVEKLIGMYNFDIPKSLFESEKSNAIKEKIKELKSQKKTDEEIKEQQQEIETQVETQVKKSLIWTFIMQKIANDAKITVSGQELIDNIMQNFGAMGTSQQILDAVLKNESLKSRFITQTQEEKVKNFIIQNVAIKE